MNSIKTENNVLTVAKEKTTEFFPGSWRKTCRGKLIPSRYIKNIATVDSKPINHSFISSFVRSLILHNVPPQTQWPVVPNGRTCIFMKDELVQIVYDMDQ